MRTNSLLILGIVATIFTVGLLASCGDSIQDSQNNVSGGQSSDFKELLTNQVDNLIIPVFENYNTSLAALQSAAKVFIQSPDNMGYQDLQSKYEEAYLAYQRAAVHNYYATANQALVETTNLYPVDTVLLKSLIESESYAFNTMAQRRANGFPVIDFMLYGNADAVAYFNGNPKRGAFLDTLVGHMLDRSAVIMTNWKGDLRDNFINNGGTSLGSSISVQLNESLVYYENRIREDKVGIPIGKLGPNDSPINPDATKIEAFYKTQKDGNESFSLDLLKAAVQEMQRIYLGKSAAGVDGQGYDDLLTARDKASVNTDIKAQFNAVFNSINARSAVTGDEDLYTNVQLVITLYKADMFPVLNVQDADGANDGD